MNLENEILEVIQEVSKRVNQIDTQTLNKNEFSEKLYNYMIKYGTGRNELILFKSKLETILQDIHSKKFSYYNSCLARIIYEYWPDNDPLMNRIAQIEKKYMKLRNNINGRYDPPTTGYKNSI